VESYPLTAETNNFLANFVERGVRGLNTQYLNRHQERVMPGARKEKAGREGRKGKQEGKARWILYLIDAGVFFSVGDWISVIPLSGSLVIHSWIVPVVVDLVGRIHKL
jgi:hypothetical protein